MPTSPPGRTVTGARLFRRLLEHRGLFGLEAPRLDGLVRIHAEAADREAEQRVLDKLHHPRGSGFIGDPR